MPSETFKFGNRIFLGNADGLRSQVEELFENASVDTIVLDLENVKLCDSYGLKFFLTCNRKAIATNKKLLFYKPDPILKEMFVSTKLNEVFCIVEEIL